MAIHLFNPLWDASGGSEWRTLSLFEKLAPHADVSLWTEYPPDSRLRGLYPIREMIATGSYPRSGTFVFVGAYWEIGPWLSMARPDRVILTYNVIDPGGLEARLAQIGSYGIHDVELRFASAMMAEHSGGRPGTVEFSPIDLDAFAPRPADERPKVVIGRHSRDQRFKHHPDDPALYRELVQQGMRVRILGGTCLEELAGSEGIELIPVNTVPVPEFLKGLDIFYYRTDPGWVETYGRVVAEAMACGLPCVAESGGGYDSLIRSGVNGFIFENGEEARSQIVKLARDPNLRHRIGQEARRSVVDLYEVENRKLIDYYLGV